MSPSHHPDPARRQAADDLVALLTPVVKAACTDNGFEAANLGIGVHGGAGYITESGVEQLARDARISQIYEGTNGVQALDLVGRKLAMHHGRLLRRFFHPAAARVAGPHPAELRGLAEPVAEALAHLQETTIWLLGAGRDREQAAAAATDYLRLFALTAFGDLWLRMAAACIESAARAGPEFAAHEARHRPVLLRPRPARDGRARPGGALRQGLHHRDRRRRVLKRSEAMIHESPHPPVEIPDVSLAGVRARRGRGAAATGRRWSTRPRAARSHIAGLDALVARRRERSSGAAAFEPGQVVGIFAPNVPEYAAAFFGVALAGGVNTTINGLYTEGEIAHQLRSSRARFLFTVSAMLERAIPAAAAAGVEAVFSFDGGEGTTALRDMLGDAGRSARARHSTRRRRSSRCRTRAARPACRRA